MPVDWVVLVAVVVELNHLNQVFLFTEAVTPNSSYPGYYDCTKQVCLNVCSLMSDFVCSGGSVPVCAGCKQRIYDEQYLQALNTDWHTVCFRCCECSASLSHWYYEKDGRLFCKKDYWAKFGELCHGCNDPITTGLIM
ncbi:LIM domain kinase 1, partial [Nibea albiflora]